ncbi:diguanylate cyclase [Rhizobium sp. 18055]|uniref:GGDEF domain-containing protein n=1 Tax=Rhizobium sp. 18055 TaxID=2681403 RepID=UPI0013580064|nr:GGDEF domain-containing protein [Rhizobium sp. 18055]
MTGATFLLMVNFSIGVAFAIAFQSMSGRSSKDLAHWCSAGFLCASVTVTVEGFAWLIPWDRATTFLSFAFFQSALTTITIGTVRHYQQRARAEMLVLPLILFVALQPLVLYDLPRDSLLHAIGYQAPSVIMTALAAAAIWSRRRRRTADLLLATILGLSSTQFAMKAALAYQISTGAGVRSYIVSTYAYYSQTAGAILSLLLGLTIFGVIVTELMADACIDAQQDSLSDTLNRKGFLSQGRTILACALPGIPQCVIMADLDHFKSINDRFGHAAGDEVIATFGSLSRQLCGEKGICGRIGGEEFAMLLSPCDELQAILLVKTLRSALTQQSYRLVPEATSISASFGIAQTRHSETLEDTMRRADLALYEAKINGRDCYKLAPAAGAGKDDQTAIANIA